MKLTPEERNHYDNLRAEYGSIRGTCEVCQKRVVAHVHELSGGPSRQHEIKYHECWLAVCLPCHNRVHLEPRLWPKSKMVAIKLLRTLEVINSCRVGRGMIDVNDVIEHMQEANR